MLVNQFIKNKWKLWIFWNHNVFFSWISFDLDRWKILRVFRLWEFFMGNLASQDNEPFMLRTLVNPGVYKRNFGQSIPTPHRTLTSQLTLTFPTIPDFSYQKSKRKKSSTCSTFQSNKKPIFFIHFWFMNIFIEKCFFEMVNEHGKCLVCYLKYWRKRLLIQFGKILPVFGFVWKVAMGNFNRGWNCGNFHRIFNSSMLYPLCVDVID